MPDSVRPVLLRAATMLQAARARQNRAPFGARQSYMASASALRQALAAGRFSAPSGYGSSISPAGLPMTSSEIAGDIQMLKNARANATPAQSAALQRIATLYATGAKEFFTGQLRDALFTNDIGSTGTIAIRGGNSGQTTGTATSAELAPRGAYGKTVAPRGAQKGGIIQSDGSVVPPNAAPTVPNVGSTPGAVVPANNPVSADVTNAAPLNVAPTAVPLGANPLNPVAPVVVPTAPVAVPVPVPVPAPPAAPENPQ